MPQTLDRLARQARLQVEARTADHRYELLRSRSEARIRPAADAVGWRHLLRHRGLPVFRAVRRARVPVGARPATATGSFRRSRRSIARARRARSRTSSTSSTRACASIRTSTSITTPRTRRRAVKRLMGEYATREAEVDDLLRRGVFVDLYQVVRQSMQISHDSYSLKQVREFFMPDAGRARSPDGGESILEFQRFLETRRQRRSSTRSVTTTTRTASRRGCCATGCSSGRREAERQFAIEIPWYVKASGAEKAPEERDENRDAPRAARSRCRRCRMPTRAVPRRRPARRICWTITAARPSPGGGRSSIG